MADRAFSFVLSLCHCLYLLSSVTGNALTEDVNAFVMAGANSVLTKPINSKALQGALARFCPPVAAAAQPVQLHLTARNAPYGTP